MPPILTAWNGLKTTSESPSMEIFLLPLLLDPLQTDLPRFPSHDIAWQQVGLHFELVKQVKALVCLDPYRMRPALQEAEYRYMLWEHLRQAKSPWADADCEKRPALSRLRDMLPRWAYERGIMPPLMPVDWKPIIQYEEPPVPPRWENGPNRP